MVHTTRIPPAEITGVKGALIKWMIEKKLGKVPTAVGVYWHNPKVLFATFGLGGKLQKWDACDEGLKSFAHMAVASLVGCTWCLDFNYFETRNKGLDVDEGARDPAVAGGGRLHCAGARRPRVRRGDEPDTADRDRRAGGPAARRSWDPPPWSSSPR